MQNFADGASTVNPNRSLKASLIQNMRFDEGSSEYKNWLAKCVYYFCNSNLVEFRYFKQHKCFNWLFRSTTLNDIYSHYILPNISAPSAKPSGQRHLSSRRRQDKPVNEDYEEGDVTGYALQQPMDVIFMR